MIENGGAVRNFINVCLRTYSRCYKNERKINRTGGGQREAKTLNYRYVVLCLSINVFKEATFCLMV